MLSLPVTTRAKSTALNRPSSVTRTDSSLPWTTSANEKYFCVTCIFCVFLSGDSLSTNPFGKKKRAAACKIALKMTLISAGRS